MKSTRRAGPNLEGFVKRPISALRFISLLLRRTAGTPRSTRFARLDLGLFTKPSKALVFLCCAVLTAACATTKVGPTAILQAPREIPEEQLLDVGIVVFSSEPMTAEKARKEGIHSEIRKAEQNFLPYHLKATLQQSSQWGAIRVFARETESVDLLIKGKILQSTGETLAVQIEARDAAARVWLDKAYEAEATTASYAALQRGERRLPGSLQPHRQ